MLVVMWIAFLLTMLFLLGSAVGSFLNVCIVRLPQGRSLIRPASCCGHCHTPIRMRDNLPLLSYWLLRGRCRQCGTPFSMRYFWIELLTGLVFVLLFHLEIGWNIHHFHAWSWYDNGYEYLLTARLPSPPFLLFAVHALLSCFLIVATMCLWEQQKLPASVTRLGVLVGLVAALLFPWPWPDPVEQAVSSHSEDGIYLGRETKPYAWGPRVGAMPTDSPWWMGGVTPRAGLYLWPVWGPLPDWLPPGSWKLGLVTGLAGGIAGAILMGLARLTLNVRVRRTAIGWGEISLMMIAGAFLGWQPIVVAGLLGLVLGWIWATLRRRQVAYSVWLVLALTPVWLGWYWIGPVVQGLFFNETRLLLLVAVLAIGPLTGVYRGNRSQQ
ncbi:MAG TPA: prepilin peptidase [Gemmataceae bacterium]|nr:prepilin peptidase [Gemmataceae bacterium]